MKKRVTTATATSGRNMDFNASMFDVDVEACINNTEAQARRYIVSAKSPGV